MRKIITWFRGVIIIFAVMLILLNYITVLLLLENYGDDMIIVNRIIDIAEIYTLSHCLRLFQQFISPAE